MSLLSDWVAIRRMLRTMATGWRSQRRPFGRKVLRRSDGTYRISRVNGSEAVVLPFEEAVTYLLEFSARS